MVATTGTAGTTARPTTPVTRAIAVSCWPPQCSASAATPAPTPRSRRFPPTPPPRPTGAGVAALALHWGGQQDTAIALVTGVVGLTLLAVTVPGLLPAGTLRLA